MASVRRRRIDGVLAAVIAMVVGVVVWLRLPLDPPGGPRSKPAAGRSTEPRPPTAPHGIARASIADAVSEPAVADPRASASADGVPEVASRPWSAPYHWFGPDRLEVHPLRHDRIHELDTAPEVLLSLGAAHQNTADWERAADFYEAFARHRMREPGRVDEDGAARALENAIAFREALGQRERALSNARDFEERFARSRPRAVARVALRTGELHDDPSERARHYRKLLRHDGRMLSPAEAIRAWARLGRARLDAGQPGRARVAYRRADRLWRWSGGEQMASAPDLSPTEHVAELGRTREAVGEARFRLAEWDFERYAAMQPPEPPSEPTVREAHRYVRGPFRGWLARKLRALRRAERSLERVRDLGPTRRAVASDARTGQLYERLSDALRGVESLRHMRVEDGEGIAELVDDGEAPWRRAVGPAVTRFDRCLDTARRTRHYGRWSQQCATALERLAPGEHPPLVELHASTGLVHEELSTSR